jgi:hypothetical protein
MQKGRGRGGIQVRRIWVRYVDGVRMGGYCGGFGIASSKCRRYGLGGLRADGRYSSRNGYVKIIECTEGTRISVSNAEFCISYTAGHEGIQGDTRQGISRRA